MVGITGRSGSGKSSVAAYYARLGHPVADGDALSRAVCEPGQPCLAALAEAFGGDILLPDGSLDRRLLGQRAFATPEGNQRLQGITHPFIMEASKALEAEARAAGRPLFFFDGAMIVGSMFESHCDRLVVVVADLKLSISRIILRDGISKSSAHARLNAQLPEARLREAADYIIENNATQAVLEQRAEAVLQLLLAEEAGSG